MKRIKVQYEIVDKLPRKLEQNVFYIDRILGKSSHKCLCGCNQQIDLQINRLAIPDKLDDLGIPKLDLTFFMKPGYQFTIEQDRQSLTISPLIKNTDCTTEYNVLFGIASTNILEH